MAWASKRNKKSFQAQRALVLLAQLAYNITVWVRAELANHKPDLQHYGMLRVIRDAFSITGKLHFDASGQLVQVVLNKSHSLAKTFHKTRLTLFAHNDLLVSLGEI